MKFDFLRSYLPQIITLAVLHNSILVYLRGATVDETFIVPSYSLLIRSFCSE